MRVSTRQSVSVIAGTVRRLLPGASAEGGSEGRADSVDVAIKLSAIRIMARVDLSENDRSEVRRGAQDSERCAGSAEVDPCAVVREVAQGEVA